MARGMTWLVLMVVGVGLLLLLPSEARADRWDVYVWGEIGVFNNQGDAVAFKNGKLQLKTLTEGPGLLDNRFVVWYDTGRWTKVQSFDNRSNVDDYERKLRRIFPNVRTMVRDKR